MADVVNLHFLGVDGWDRPVYIDDEARLWKDVDPFTSGQATLCSATNNEFEGEPDADFEGIPKYEYGRAVWVRIRGKYELKAEGYKG